MTDTTDRRQTAIDTFANHTTMSEREAEVYVLRRLAGVRRGETARLLGIAENTVDNHLSSAAEKAALPNIKDVNRQSPRNTGYNEGVAWELRFPNGAMVRYVWRTDTEAIHEQTISAADPHSIHKDWDVGGTADGVAEYTLETLQEYTKEWRHDLDVCATDAPDVFAALTGYAP